MIYKKESSDESIRAHHSKLRLYKVPPRYIAQHAQFSKLCTSFDIPDIVSWFTVARHRNVSLSSYACSDGPSSTQVGLEDDMEFYWFHLRFSGFDESLDRVTERSLPLVNALSYSFKCDVNTCMGCKFKLELN